MHGTNVIRKLEDGDGKQLQVREIFYTLQGEGPFAGHPAVFVRLTGCHLRCHFCDTEWNDATDKTLLTVDIVECVRYAWNVGGTVNRPKPLVILTGGEPARQPIDALVDAFFDMDYSVQIETAGTFWRDCMASAHVSTVVSPKTAIVNPKVAYHARAYKYVIRDGECDPNDGLPMLSTQREGRTCALARLPASLPRSSVYLSPCDEGDPARNVANMRYARDIALRHGYTLGVQLHKLVGLP